MPRTVLAAIAALLVLAAPAAAEPGDPLPQPISPVGGAAVAANPEGVAVTFTCPAYRQSPADEAPAPNDAGYGVRASRDPSGSVNAIAFAQVTRSAADPSQCTAVLKDNGYENLMQQTPGTYYWVVDRVCFCGGAETEAGPVASFTITAATAKLTAQAPKKAYAGYTFRVGLATDLPDGQAVSLQRQSGSAWKTVAKPATVTKGAAKAEVTLGKGAQKLRWVAIRGGQTDAGTPATVSVVKARKWSTTKRDVGTYDGAGKNDTLRFKVAKAGRELRGFRASVSTSCIGSPTDVTKNYLKTSFALVKTIKVAPDGRFLAVSKVSETTAIVSGRLRKGKVTGGRVELSYPLCSGSRTFKAERK